MKKIIEEVDDHAFIVVHNVKDVSGGTFLMKKHKRRRLNLTTRNENSDYSV
ncbi:DUF2179 domain-containing protein [Geomicrobium sp. JCM 19055]|uniref:DUF2179 domain-containing protein n=1 Tax=Geomicrobium sp. JCM 19055 TaxID=1460649 RepID=UPI00045EDB9F|nr:DUF2179 domain-containing protein [Geomicrobium sp. JCM 19055]GAJ98530.1 hypothetical protein JCM19055_1466 [Geomicrobium sp. JCM 19055]